MRFPITVYDNFFTNPDVILDLAENMEYQDRGHNFFPGQITKKRVDEVDFSLHTYITSKISELFWDFNHSAVSWNNSSIDFMKNIPGSRSKSHMKYGLIHTDNLGGEHPIDLAGVIYLTKNPKENTGTSFFDPIDRENVLRDELLPIKEYNSGKRVSGIKDLVKRHHSNFTESMRVQNKYNRLCAYSPDVWHSPTFFHEEQVRYTLRFFISYKTPVVSQRNWSDRNLL